MHPRTGRLGQSIAEFALVFPILFFLLVAIVDFTRVFAAGIVLEAAARDAAEIAAQAYVQNPPPGAPSSAPLNAPAPSPAHAPYYNALHDKTARVVCAETKELPETDFTGGVCPTWPNVRVCVHDDVMDNGCGTAISGFAASVPPECTELNGPWTAASAGGTTSRRYIEVRVCQPFGLFFDFPFIPLNDMYLQRSRTFVIPCYFALGQDDCG